MLMHVVDSSGKTYHPQPKTPNLVHGIPAGTKITRVFVAGNSEECQFISAGEPCLISMAAIRRISQAKLAA